MKKINIERLSHYAVILMAFLAFFVSVRQVSITQKHNRLSVKPYMDSSILQADSVMTVLLTNRGFGPAILKSISFEYKGVTYDKLEELLVASGEKKNRMGSFNFGKNALFASGEERLLVELKNREIRGVKVYMVFTSIYEEEFKYEFIF